MKRKPGGGDVKMRAVWTCGRGGTQLRPERGKVVAAIEQHAKACVKARPQ